MELSYWQARWRKGKIGWHMEEVFPLLKQYWPRLDVPADATVLIPLCGKSLDIDWLAEQGHQVIGVETSERAVQELAERLPGDFKRLTKRSFTCYKNDSVQLWCGDFIKLRKAWLPEPDAAYDKAALIALPPMQRAEYAAHLQRLLPAHGQILLNTFEYKQEEMTGPPFAVFEGELKTLFGKQFDINLLHTHSLFDELPNFQRRGLQSYLDEKFYQLKPK